MAEPGIQIFVYSPADLTKPLDIISRRWDPTALEEHNRDGGGSFKIRINDDSIQENPDLLDEGNIVQIRVNGVIRQAFEIKKKNIQIVPDGEYAGEWLEVSGTGPMEWLTHANVLPERGLSQIIDERAFNFTSIQGSWFKPAAWTTAVSRGLIKKIATYPADSPEEWPVGLTDVHWIWSTTANPAPIGDVFFRREFSTQSSANYRMVATADDYAAIYVDGVRVMVMNEFGTYNKAFSQDLELEPGNHIIAVQARNVSGPGGFAMALCAVSDNKATEDIRNDERVVWTGGDLSLWRTLAYPAQRPGWTLGEILIKLLDEAKARGVTSIQRIVPTFTAANDSNGVPWPSTHDLVCGVGETYREVVQKIMDSYADMWVTPDFKLHAAPIRGIDRSVPIGSKDPVIFRRGLNVLSADTEVTAEIANAAFIKTSNGMVEVPGPASSISKYGRREAYLSAADSAGSALSDALADQLFDKFANPRYTPTLTIVSGDEYRPWEDFQVGDWILAPSDKDPLKLTKRRVMSIAASETASGQTTYVCEIDSIQESYEERVNRWLQSIANNNMSGGVSGTSDRGGKNGDLPMPGTESGTPPIPRIYDRRIPTAPTGVTVTADIVETRGSRPGGTLAVTWNHNNLALDGSELIPARYQAFIKEDTATVYSSLGEAATGTRQLHASGLRVKTILGVAVKYDIVVRALSDTGKMSDFSQPVRVTMVDDTTAPLKPAAPVVTVDRAVFKIVTTTKDVNGAAVAPDYEYTIVESAATSTATTWVEHDRLYGPGDTLVGGFGYNTRHFRIRHVDRSGNISVPSNSASATAKPLVDADIILSAIDAADTIITNIGEESLKTGAILSRHLAENAVGQAALQSNIISMAKLAADVEAEIAKGVAAQGTANSALASANGKNKVEYRASLPASGTTVGDTVFIRSNTAGSPITGQHRWDGDSWVQEALSHQVIASVDLGKATVGELDGVYVKARTLRANTLMVSDFTNFAPPLDKTSLAGEDNGDWDMVGQMYVGTTTMDSSGFRFHVSNGTVESRAYGPIKTVDPGEKLYGSAVLYRGSGTVAVYLRWSFLDKNKASVGTTSAPMSTTSANGTLFEVTATVPANAAYAQWYIIIAAGTGETGFYSQVGRRQATTTYIADGAITTNKVLANAIQSRHLLVGDFTNRFIGSDFETAPDTPWDLSAVSWHYRTNGTAKSGTYCLRLNGALATAGTYSTPFTGDTKVVPGETWLFRLYGYKTSTFNGTAGNSKLRIASVQSGTLLGEIPFTTFTNGWNTAPYELEITIPTGTTSLDISIRSDHTAGDVYLDDMQMRRMSEQSLILNLGVEKLVASTASMNTAVIDKLWTDVVRSRRITTDMMVVGRGVNGIVDDYFDSEDLKALRHTASGSWGAWDRSTAAGVNLNYYGSGSLTAGSNRTFHFQTTSTSYDKNSFIPVIAGQKWALDVIYSSSVGGPRGTMRVIKKDGTTFYTTEGFSNTGWDLPGTRWSMNRIYTVPDDVAYIMPAVQFSADCTGAWVWGGSRFTNMADASLIVDGSVVARHLTVTDELTTKVLGAYKIKAVNIDTNDLQADTGFVANMKTKILTADSITSTTLKSDAITSKHTLTGPLIQTSATASRGIKFNATSFTVYNGSGGKTFDILASTGAVTATGTFTTGNVGDAKYATLRQDGSGGRADFYTGTTNQHGYIYARDLGDGQQSRMTLGVNDPDVIGENMPVLGLTRYEGRLSFGSRHILVANTGIVIDGNAFNDPKVVLMYGGLDMRTSNSRIQFRGSSEAGLGYLGNRPESSFSDFELRSVVGNVRLTAPSGSAVLSTTIYNITTTNAANVYIGTDYKLYRSTSASKYKVDVKPMSVEKKVLDIKLKDWIDKSEKERYDKYKNAPRPLAEQDQADANAVANMRRIPGLIAEELVSAGYSQFVHFGQDGQTEGIMYERFAFAQIQALHAELEAMRIEIAALKLKSH